MVPWWIRIHKWRIRTCRTDSADSLLAAIGGFIAPIFAPLDLESGAGSSFLFLDSQQKEAIVSTMGVLANVAESQSEDTVTVARGYSGMVPQVQ